MPNSAAQSINSPEPVAKPWLASYPDNIPANISLDASTTLVTILEQACSRFGDITAYQNKFANAISYAELDKYSAQFASYLQHELGIERGDSVAIMLPNLIQYPIALFGILRAGAAVVNVNPLYTPRELEHQLKDSNAKAIVILENTCHVLQEVIANTSVRQVVTTQIGDMASFPKSFIINKVVKYVKKMVPKWHLPGSTTFSSALMKGAEQAFVPVSITGDDTAFLQYTGGTTGRSKGAILSHGNMLANLHQCYAWLGSEFVDGEEFIVTALPLYHVYALTSNCLMFLVVGGTNLLITDPRDMDDFMAQLKEVQMTVITGVNTLFIGMTAHPEFPDVDFSKLKLTSGGGAAVQKSVSERWKEITSKPIVEGYGLTECSPVACANRFDITEHTGTVGLPLPSTEVCTIDADLNIQAIGERGELCIRGPQVMQGYLNRPDATEETISQGGWLRTGDVAIIDDAGYVKIVDRLKDMIIVSGFNVFPNEIEDVVAQHPGVLEVACIGVPSDKTGEAVKVFIVKQNPNDKMTEADIKDYCKDNLTGYKVPKHYEFRAELPKSNVGKILRKDLRDQEVQQAS